MSELEKTSPHNHPSIESERINPFKFMKIDDNTMLNQIEGRFICPKCTKSRKFYCYTCFIPVGDLILPKVSIPIFIDIIKHKQEIDGKSTSGHAAVICPNKCKVYSYPNIPDYSNEEGVVLIYPGKDSITVTQIFNENIVLKYQNENFGLPQGFNMGTLLRTRLEEVKCPNIVSLTGEHFYTYENLPIKKAVFIDSTWNQSRSIFKDERISCLKQIVLQNRVSQFWRHQKKSPRWYLATIEAIHQLLLEIHANAWGINRNYKGLQNLGICPEFYKFLEEKDVFKNDMFEASPYNGQYDNLLFFFINMYDLIHKHYDHNLLKSYRRPINLI
ncbi:DTWD1 family protein [Megaselia abdita]